MCGIDKKYLALAGHHLRQSRFKLLFFKPFLFLLVLRLGLLKRDMTSFVAIQF